MQYQPKVEIITVEEWLQMQDIPFKDLIFKRMGIQRNTVFTEQVAKTLTMFADMVEQGADPGDAVDMIAESMQNEQVPNQLGNVAAGSPQAAQQGMELPQEEGMPMM
jgi:Flp pilus assembly protein TadB